MDAKDIYVRGERSIGAQRKKRKEMCCNVIIVLKEVILVEIALILLAGNVEKKDMKKKHALLNFLDYLLFGIKE